MSTFSIYQLATPNIDAYAKYSVASVKAYCERHGYQSFVQRKKMIDDMHINWSKIAMMIEGLEQSKSDYLVLLDADTVIVNLKIKLEKMLPKPNQVISFARDNYFGRFNKPNAGLVIIRNSTEGLQLMKDWLHAARNEGKAWADIHPRNQNVYWKFVESKWSEKQRLLSFRFCKKYYRLYDYFSFRKFVYHVTYTNGDERSNEMKKLMDRYVPDADIYLRAVEKQLSEERKLIQIT